MRDLRTVLLEIFRKSYPGLPACEPFYPSAEHRLEARVTFFRLIALPQAQEVRARIGFRMLVTPPAWVLRKTAGTVFAG